MMRPGTGQAPQRRRRTPDSEEPGISRRVWIWWRPTAISDGQNRTRMARKDGNPPVEHLPDLFGQRDGREGLSQNMRAIIQFNPDQRVVRTSRHEKDLKILPPRKQRLSQLRPVHSRHHYIGDYQVNCPGMPFANVESGRRRAHLKHGVPTPLQADSCQSPDRVVVFHQQNGFRAPIGRAASASRIDLSSAASALGRYILKTAPRSGPDSDYH